MMRRAALLFALMLAGLACRCHAQRAAMLITLPKDSTGKAADSTRWLARLRADGADSLAFKGFRTWRFIGPTDLLVDSADVFEKAGAVLQRDREGRVHSLDLWGLAAIGAYPVCRDQLICGAGAKIGIIDGGSGPHPDLRIVDGRNYSLYPADTLHWQDEAGCNGHGTHTAGTAAGLNTGVAPLANLYALRIAWSDCALYVSSMYQAMGFACANHLDVVNASISFGSQHSQGINNLIEQVTECGVVVVAASGNDGGPVNTPANAPAAIAVCAYDGSGMASFSSNGPEVSLCAPGVGITSTLPGGFLGDKSGTSMAAPHVTGCVALVRRVVAITPDSIKRLLVNTADAFAWGKLLRCDKAIDALKLTSATVSAQSHQLTAGLAFAGCTELNHPERFLEATSSDPWLTWTHTGNQLCWSGTPPATAIGTTPTLTIRGQ